MIHLLLHLIQISTFAFPVNLTPSEIDSPHKGIARWQCFATSQIKKMECLEWTDNFFGKIEERSDLDLVIEGETELHEYGFNSATSVCSEFKRDFIDILHGQKYFCIYGNPLGFIDFDSVQSKKPIYSWVYECLKTPRGQVAWHGGFGFCVGD